jgi:hypothetical protein
VAALYGHQGGHLEKLFPSLTCPKLTKGVESTYQNYYYYLHEPKEVLELSPKHL